MGLFAKLLKAVLRSGRKARNVSGYQLWLECLGDQPEAVIEFLIEDMFIAGMMEGPGDLPELPWMVIELPAGSDTYSIVHIKGGSAREARRRSAGQGSLARLPRCLTSRVP